MTINLPVEAFEFGRRIHILGDHRFQKQLVFDGEAAVFRVGDDDLGIFGQIEDPDALPFALRGGIINRAVLFLGFDTGHIHFYLFGIVGPLGHDHVRSGSEIVMLADGHDGFVFLGQNRNDG